MKKLIFALNSFLEAYDEGDFYSCELKNDRIRLYGHYSWGLYNKLTSCGFQCSANSSGFSLWSGVVRTQLVKPYATNGRVK